MRISCEGNRKCILSDLAECAYAILHDMAFYMIQHCLGNRTYRFVLTFSKS